MGTMTGKLDRRSLSDEAISRFIDPRTGQRLRPLGVVGGKTVWPTMGASPDDPSSEESKETEGTDDDPEGGSGTEGSDGSDKGDPDAKITALEDEKNRHVRRRQEAEAELEETKKKLKAFEDRDSTDAEKAANTIKDLEGQVSSLQDKLQDALIGNAFLSDNTYKWHNPGRALQMVDLSDVEIDSDGKVTGLVAALKKLAQSDAYLLKSDDGGEEEPPPATGKQKNGRKTKAEEDAQHEKDLKKYPALRR